MNTAELQCLCSPWLGHHPFNARDFPFMQVNITLLVENGAHLHALLLNCTTSAQLQVEVGNCMV